MNCEACSQPLGNNRSGFVLCANCGHVTIVSSSQQAQPIVQQQPAQPSHLPSTHKASRVAQIFKSLPTRIKNKFVLGGVVALLVVGMVGVTALKNVDAQKHLNQAASQDKAGNYQAAAKSLRSSSTFLVLPSLSHKLHAESLANHKWLTYYGLQTNAKQLAATQNYTEALAILQKIPKNYPTYTSVTKDIQLITAQQAAAVAQQTAAQQAADAAKKTAEATAKAKSKPPVKSSATPTLGCFPPSSIKGKRYISTAAFGSVLGATSVAQVQQIMQSFFSQYGISVEITSVTQSSYAKQFSTYKVAGADDLCSLRAYSAIIVDEWSKYPSDWVSNSGVKNIIIVKNLVVSGQNRAAMPDPVGSDMYYDLTYSGDYAREVIHHEYDHLIEYHYFGSYSHSDPTWQSYNPSGFSYGSGGSVCYANPGSCSNGSHPLSGFVTGYSITGIEEDKAELYAYLMTGTYYQQLKSWLPGDANLNSKVNYYKQFIASHSSTMSGGYFDQIDP